MDANNSSTSKMLDENPADRLAAFKKFTVSHPKLLETDAALERVIREPGGSRIIFVIGPSGVGKTTLFKRISTRLATQYKDPDDPGQIPVVAVEAPAASSGQFSWRHFYVECLRELRDPITLRNCARLDLFGDPVPAKERRSEFELRFAVETALKHRKTKIVLIDEAHHISIVASGRRMKDQTEFLKSTGNMTDVTYVLFGTYDLLQLCNLNGQLANRSTLIHFPRYDARNEKDIETFQNILLTFQANLPLEVERDLEADWESLYIRSIGCVGACKLLLNKAVAAAMEESAKSLTLDHIEHVAHSLRQCEQQAKDALHGELRFVETDDQLESLRNLLGLTGYHDSGKNEGSKNGAKRNAKPGQRKPTRDKVGQPA